MSGLCASRAKSLQDGGLQACHQYFLVAAKTQIERPCLIVVTEKTCAHERRIALIHKVFADLDPGRISVCDPKLGSPLPQEPRWRIEEPAANSPTEEERVRPKAQPGQRPGGKSPCACLSTIVGDESRLAACKLATVSRKCLVDLALRGEFVARLDVGRNHDDR